jgi:hypothetical protein
LPPGLTYWEDRLLLTPIPETDWTNFDEHLIEKFETLSEPAAHSTGYYPPENMGLLREYLGSEDLFQWVCALAIYPSIQWEVLIALGSAVLKERRAGHLAYVYSSSPDHPSLLA